MPAANKPHAVGQGLAPAENVHFTDNAFGSMWASTPTDL